MAKKRKLNKTDWRSASGKIDYTLLNDYMFQAVLESNERILRGLISSMMHIPIEDIMSLEIENPIMLGKKVDDKYFVLDILVNLNDNQRINLEMQVVNCYNWDNRSLSYLCRNFDNLQRGDDYNSVIDVTHIGFLDYDLFEDDKELYAQYLMQNVRSHRIYNSKFSLRVLSLNQTKLATDEDREWHIDDWARLFKAKTWEELKMIAEKNELYSEVAESIYIQNTDERVRFACEARKEAERHEAYMKNKIEEAERHEAYMKNKIEEAERNEAYMKNKLEETEANFKALNKHNNQLLDEKKKLEEELEALRAKLN